MNFITNILKKNINGTLLLTDTDSLLHEILKNEYFYEDKDLFDFSEYPQDLKFFDTVNKKVIGEMKDESKEKIISELVCWIKVKNVFINCCIWWRS